MWQSYAAGNQWGSLDRGRNGCAQRQGPQRRGDLRGHPAGPAAAADEGDHRAGVDGDAGGARALRALALHLACGPRTRRTLQQLSAGTSAKRKAQRTRA